MTSDKDYDGLIAPDKLFLSKAGVIALLLGVALFASGAFFDHTLTGAIAFGSCVVISTAFSAFAGNNRISTITLAIDIFLLSLFALGVLLIFLLKPSGPLA